MYKLYKITNLINQKIYIGITKSQLKERMANHISDAKSPLYPLHRAMKKYGAHNFIIELIEQDTVRENISTKEQPTIEALNAHISKNGYNVALGGYGGNLGHNANAKRQSTRENFSIEKKKIISAKISLSNTGQFRSAETKQNMSLLQIAAGGYGPGTHSRETKEKISHSNRGKVRNEDSIQRYRTSAKLRGTGPQLSGKKVSCICCKKEWDLGNFSQHITRNKNNELQ